VYIPPDNSKYFNNNLLDLFYSEVESFTSQHKFVIISGDFNARTSNLPDIVEVDQNIFNSIDIDTSDVFDSCIDSQLRNCNMTLIRSSKDGTANRLGRLLTDFCRRNEMAILNGRCFLDTEGNLT